MSRANIAAALVEVASRFPDAPAVIAPRGTHRPGPYAERRWTFRQLDEESDTLARGLARRGVFDRRSKGKGRSALA